MSIVIRLNQGLPQSKYTKVLPETAVYLSDNTVNNINNESDINLIRELDRDKLNVFHSNIKKESYIAMDLSDSVANNINNESDNNSIIELDGDKLNVFYSDAKKECYIPKLNKKNKVVYRILRLSYIVIRLTSNNSGEIKIYI
jgi:hypothetical protein